MRIALLGIAAATVFMATPALADDNPALPVSVSTTGACEAGYNYVIASFGAIWVCGRTVYLNPSVYIAVDGQPCASNFLVLDQAPALRICVGI